MNDYHYTLVQTRYPRAAHGRHICEICLKPIPQGERYTDRRIAAKGTMVTYRHHGNCQFILPNKRHEDEKRLKWYVAEIDDPIPHKTKTTTDYNYEMGELLAPTEKHSANLISSLCDDGLHRLAIDIDFDVKHYQLDAADAAYFLLAWEAPKTGIKLGWTICGRIIPSRTAGHWHLYSESKAYTWIEYEALLTELAGLGLIEYNYLNASRVRGQTLLRIQKEG